MTGLKSLSSLGCPVQTQVKDDLWGSPSSVAQDFSSLGHTLSGPATFFVWSLLSSPLTWYAVKVAGVEKEGGFSSAADQIRCDKV